MTRKHPEIKYSLLPEHLRAGMERYIENGVLPGHFLQAVLLNDLVQAFVRADEISIVSMHEIAGFLYWEMPSPAWGSAEKMRAWSKAREGSESV